MDNMPLNSKKIGRIGTFKYIGFTVVILIGLTILFMLFNKELENHIFRSIIHPVLREKGEYIFQFIVDLTIIYYISGQVGKNILEKHKDPLGPLFLDLSKCGLGFYVLQPFQN